MTKIDIYSGFLGAGKTTLIKKMIQRAYKGEKIVLIENEFGEIGIDGGFLKDAGINITEMNSGCICCSLVGDFSRALTKVQETYHPDRILIEPSGVGKLSDVLAAVLKADLPDAEIGALCAVVDAKKCKMYMKNFGEFFCDQIKTARTVIFSHADTATPEKVEEALALVRAQNPDAVVITTPVDTLSDEQLRDAVCHPTAHNDFEEQVIAEAMAHRHDDDDDDDEDEHDHHCCHHHHDDDDDDEDEHDHHCCHHHDDDDDDEDEHDHHCCHHHHDDDDDDEDEHDHHCHHHHHHHHGHDADEVFTSWGRETTRAYTDEEIDRALSAFDSEEAPCGVILRAKGIVPAADGTWIHFDYVPGEHDIRCGSAGVTGRLCVIGSGLDEEKIAALFGLKA